MDSSKSTAGGSAKTAGSRSKTALISASTRLQRNQAEKERRDKLNGFISELATLVPMVSNASKPLDKVSILRLAAAEMRLHFSCLNPKKYKKKPLVLPPAVISSLDLIEKTIGGFILVTTLTGLIVFCSRSIEDYLGYQNIDVMGNRVVKYIYEDDIKYFESQVHSVIKSLKRAHKKTKLIKSHMLQRPLPRSTETCRPRNMIFKISVHQNDTSENMNGKNGSSDVPDSRPKKDFGYSAVVLMFIEPVRFEPEIDITYIDTNQDAYFTRHGLKGEIIYADQRISTITGYMPHDVQGTSAYQYICSSDVPIALFAQKAMFSSPDGKGVIVYRLRIRDMRFIYLQSSGQIVYNESSNEISHFVCFNRLLSEDEGSQELKKFQQRYAPQIMEAKMLQVKQNPGSASPTTDLAYDQVMKLINDSLTTNTSLQTNSFGCSAVQSAVGCQGVVDQSKNVASSSSFPTKANFVHSSEAHSITSPANDDRSSSITLLDCAPKFLKEERMDALIEKTEQRLGGGPLRRTECRLSLSSSPYKTATSERKSKVFSPEQCCNVNNFDQTVMNQTFCDLVNSPNDSETYQIHQNTQRISTKPQNGTVHFVNVNLFDGTNFNSTDTVNQSMVFDPALPQTITFQQAAAEPTFKEQNDTQMMDIFDQMSECLRHNEPTILSTLLESVESAPNMLYPQLSFSEDYNYGNEIPHTEVTSNPSDMYNASSVPSFYTNSIVDSDVYNGVDFGNNHDSYSEIDSYSDYNIPNSISNYNGVYNDLDTLGSKTFSSSEMNGLHETIPSLDGLQTIPPMEVFDSMNTPREATFLSDVPQKTVQSKSLTNGINDSVAPTLVINDSKSEFSLTDEHGFTTSIDLKEILSNPTLVENAPMNNELQSELEKFFINLRHLNTSQASAAIKGISELPLDSGR